MTPLSVVICCANVADTLGPACASVAWADQIIVVDSGSTDATPDIARRHAHRYVVEPWRGYSAQKAYGASLADHAWVLVLDGDETVTPELAAEWQALPDAERDRRDLFLVRRRNYVLGRPVRAWDPDWQSRFIRRGRVRWADESLHDARQADPERVGRLNGRLEHKRHSQAGFSDYFSGRRLDERLLLVAEQMHRRGHRARPRDLVTRPLGAFLKFYLIKGGWRDGAFGLLIGQKAAISVQLKYAALWYIQQRQHQDPPPGDA